MQQIRSPPLPDLQSSDRCPARPSAAVPGIDPRLNQTRSHPARARTPVTLGSRKQYVISEMKRRLLGSSKFPEFREAESLESGPLRLPLVRNPEAEGMILRFYTSPSLPETFQAA
ncbi:hypothetical protein [Microvirga massiliensis]|uniref:hypothetical protein n=1 Tax=Microvirga massiliensis TaxID=1033741 RepID=UPI00062B8116|nr:hypothetical protein [Microvirga massiliensis]